jgi:hypothetical protein
MHLQSDMLEDVVMEHFNRGMDCSPVGSARTILSPPASPPGLGMGYNGFTAQEKYTNYTNSMVSLGEGSGSGNAAVFFVRVLLPALYHLRGASACLSPPLWCHRRDSASPPPPTAARYALPCPALLPCAAALRCCCSMPCPAPPYIT